MRKFMLICAATAMCAVAVTGCGKKGPTELEKQEAAKKAAWEQMEKKCNAVQTEAAPAWDAARKKALAEKPAAYGALPANWQKLAKDAITAQLKDPAAPVKFGDKPRRNMTAQRIEDADYQECVRRNSAHTGKPADPAFLLHWTVAVDVDAKDAGGARTGFKKWNVDLKDGKVIRVTAPRS